jgi:hypothetical protein
MVQKPFHCYTVAESVENLKISPTFLRGHASAIHIYILIERECPTTICFYYRLLMTILLNYYY